MKNAKAAGTTYYVRATGGVSTCVKAGATDYGTPANWLNMTGVNLCSGANAFIAGDRVLFSSLYGDYTTTLTIPSGGTGIGSEVTYSKVPAEEQAGEISKPVISNSDAYQLYPNGKNYVVVSGFSLISSSAVVSCSIVKIEQTIIYVTFSNLSLTKSNNNGYYINISSSNNDHLTFDTLTGTGGDPNKMGLIATGTGNTNWNVSHVNFPSASLGINLSNITGLNLSSISVNSITLTNIVFTSGNYVNSSTVNQGAMTFTSCSGDLTVGGANISSPLSGYPKLLYFNGGSYTSLQINDVNINGLPYTGMGAVLNNITATNRVRIARLSVTTAPTLYSLLIMGTSSKIDVSDSNTYGGAGFQAIDTANDITYTNCTATSSGASGFWADNSAHNISYYHCLAQNGVGDGFGAGSLGGPVHDINWWYSRSTGNGVNTGNASGDGFTSHIDNYNINSYYCISDHNTTSGWAMWGSGSGVIYNSIAFANSVNNSFADRGNFAFSLNAPGHYEVKNSIGVGGFPREIYKAGSGTVIFDYNIYQPIDINHFYNTIQDSNDTSWTTYQGVAPYTEPHSLNDNPDFVNASGNYSLVTDFMLQVTSPAINAGLDTGIATLLLDYAGKQRYNMPGVLDTGGFIAPGTLSYYDIGAYEYVTPPEPVLSSSSHPVQTDWYDDATPDMAIDNVADPSTTTYKYLVDQELNPDINLVKAGTASATDTFTVAGGMITAPGVWYVHVLGINLDGDYSDTYGTYKIQFDDTTPTGTVSIEEAITNDAVISLILNATSTYSPISEMRFSNDGATWSAWETYATSKDWNLETGAGGSATAGNRTVSAQFKNGAGTSSATATDTVIYDVPPTFSNLPGTTEQVDPSEGQLITINPYIIQVKPDSGVGIEKVEFLVDDALICTETVADANGVYSCSWDTARYQGTIRIIAYDIYGATTTITREVTVDPSLYTITLPQTGKK